MCPTLLMLELIDAACIEEEGIDEDIALVEGFQMNQSTLYNLTKEEEEEELQQQQQQR